MGAKYYGILLKYIKENAEKIPLFRKCFEKAKIEEPKVTKRERINDMKAWSKIIQLKKEKAEKRRNERK